MVSKHFYIRKDQEKDLEELPGKTAEHIRTAIDEYLAKKKKVTLKSSFSPSKIIKEDTNARRA